MKIKAHPIAENAETDPNKPRCMPGHSSHNPHGSEHEQGEGAPRHIREAPNIARRGEPHHREQPLKENDECPSYVDQKLEIL